MHNILASQSLLLFKAIAVQFSLFWFLSTAVNTVQWKSFTQDKVSNSLVNIVEKLAKKDQDIFLRGWRRPKRRENIGLDVILSEHLGSFMTGTDYH